MIKRSIFQYAVLLVFSLPFFCFAQGWAIISGFAPKIAEGTEIRITENNPFDSRRPLNIYSVKVQDGKFTQKLRTGKGNSFYLSLGEEMHEMYLEPGKIRIDIPASTLKDLIISGSKSDSAYTEFSKDWKSQKIYKSLLIIQEKWLSSGTTADKVEYDSLKNIFDQEKLKFVTKRISDRPNSHINSALLNSVMDFMPEESLKTTYVKLNLNAQKNAQGKYIKFKIDSLFIGGAAPFFKQPDSSGKPITLDHYRGKYLLLDFWASWCIPCRAENPNLVKAYKNFKSRNFEILSVSVDTDDRLWRDAVKSDQLPWTQVSDLGGFRSPIAVKYMIHYVPCNFLISPNGKVVAKNIRGEKLQEILSELP